MTKPATHPRDVADKSPKENLYRAIDLALSVESDAVRLNTQTFNANRYTAVGRLNDYEELKDRARAIKEEAIRRLPELVEQLTRTITARGGRVFYARTKHDAVGYVREVCTSHGVKLAVKAKSITTEEIELNRALEADGIEVAETDLAEFILQVSKEQPSHIVAPAIHRSRERISELFKEHFRTDQSLETGEQLTEFARDILREKFLAADIGISGANLVAAEEGTLLLVESEGNIRLTTHLPAVHVAVVGVEKIIPSRRDFGTFIELLAASATGQPLSTYTNILEPPLPLPVLNLNGRSDTTREFHLVLVDNGRMRMREDEGLRDALYCIRCSACMNVCANFQAVGGHAFGGECYTGGIGGAWTVGTSGSLAKGRFAELCTGCSRCIPNCPVKIDIPRLNTTIKNRLLETGEPSLQKQFFGRFSTLAKLAALFPGFANAAGSLRVSKALLETVVGVDKRRAIPRFAPRTLEQEYAASSRQGDRRGAPGHKEKKKLLLFPDVYTNYNNPRVGMATVSVFRKLGLPVTLGRVMEDGRSALSQGLVQSATKSAQAAAAYLGDVADAGFDVLFAEPSVLAMVRQDWKTLLGDDVLFKKLRARSFDPLEYLNRMIDAGELDVRSLKERITKPAPQLFYHGHCQMKSLGIGLETPTFFRALGFTVEVSSVECCGMAGSFGYKKQYYEVSKNVGRDLEKQIDRVLLRFPDTVIVASGTSCREQIGADVPRGAVHPMEFLDTILQSSIRPTAATG
jgi:iron-sulfur cluster protein